LVWNGKGFPEEWREGLIAPIYKKGEAGDVRNYRGVTLLCTAYKVYAAILTERLRQEMEEKGILPETQAGFRKKRGTMDNIYILQHVIRREVRKKGGKMYGFFMDLKAAFDRVDRKRLWKAMEKRGVRRGLTERVKEIYESTKCAVRSQGKRSEWFWTEKGVRQGCPLNPLLFSILIADVEEKMRKGQVGGVLVEEERIWTLAYADDLVILAKSEEGMKEMLKRMERFLKRKKLQLNIEKTKMVCFKKGGGRRREKEWKWEGKKIEEVTEIKYLGYIIKRNGENDDQIKELKKKANRVIGQVWGIAGLETILGEGCYCLGI